MRDFKAVCFIGRRGAPGLSLTVSLYAFLTAAAEKQLLLLSPHLTHQIQNEVGVRAPRQIDVPHNAIDASSSYLDCKVIAQ